MSVNLIERKSQVMTEIQATIHNVAEFVMTVAYAFSVIDFVFRNLMR